MTGAGPDPISAEAIRTLYRQVPNSFAAALVVTVFMAFTAWPYSQPVAVIGWLVVQGLSQVLRLVLFLAYRRRNPAEGELAVWAGLYTAYMALAGIIWGATIFLFVHPAEPITLALTLCGLYGISAGSVPGNAYNLPGCYAFVGTIFAVVLVRMVMLGDFGHVVLGLASALFAVIMILFGRVQNRTLRDGFAIRFENVQLLAEARAAQGRAEAASLAKSQFLAAASHDLRQPLYALSLFSGSLTSIALDADGKALVGRIQDNIAAMETLFNGLLDLSRLDAGAVTTDVQPFAVQPLFDRLERIFAPAARAQSLTLSFAPTRAWALGDAVLSEQILMNLVANALRYTPVGGVAVGVRRRDAGLEFQVADTGRGIAAEDQARIFDEFVQLGNVERDRSKGLGLGLAIAARTARLMDSRITLASRPGKGSRFGFCLPRAVAVPGGVAGQVGGEKPVQAIRVLVIDDDEAIRHALGLLFQQWQVACVLTADVAAARGALSDGGFDAVLCDHRLREGHAGLDFLLELKAEGRGGLCLVTGDVDPQVIRRAHEAGVFLVQKPVDPARLRALLNHLTAVTA
ncbi:hypothetical protein ABAC460_03325 [Asticcacaulis sp. AC460]|uniref:ATP-binding response regulator n=1 Tax=Asticcacaulis sp. AC460 TaxID=1282360 RepID=UPI0003C3C6F7|nr:hybrid sensor histidine kinase/response regulator [Asticcacaulis sp. AC460]ESQ91942.1 hypothetical protein ABAC460_03325 [Asticcacaulis sp. AC460]